MFTTFLISLATGFSVNLIIYWILNLFTGTSKKVFGLLYGVAATILYGYVIALFLGWV